MLEKILYTHGEIIFMAANGKCPYTMGEQIIAKSNTTRVGNLISLFKLDTFMFSKITPFVLSVIQL